MEDFTDIVYRALNNPDPPRGVRYIHLHRVKLQVLVTPGTRNCPRELGSGSFLIIGTHRVLWRLGPDLGFGSWGCLRFMGPDSISFSWHLCVF
jgi:hypothetical protein